MTAQNALADPVAPGFDVFAESYPRAVDMPQSHYEAYRQEFDDAAVSAGYRLAGFRLERAVFTSSP